MTSRLALGTVQFGVHYGIASGDARVSGAEASEIIRVAREARFTMVDTASVYGNSEEILGELNMADMEVVSKLPPVPTACSEVTEWALGKVTESIGRLRVPRLYGLLVHRSRDLVERRGPDVRRALKLAKSRGLTRKVGVSIYDPNELETLLNACPEIEIVQAPFNMLDRQLETSGWLRRLKERDIEVHVRSVFLQGLLLMNAAQRPREFDRWQAVWDRWEHWITDNGIEPLQACLALPLSRPEISRIIIAVDSAAQLRQILDTCRTAGKSVVCPPQLASNDPGLINPSRWKSQLKPVIAIVQARMGSVRYPGKVMRPIGGTPMIGLLLERLGKSRYIARIVLATSTQPAEQPLVDYVSSLGYPVYRGSERDVLDRYYQCATEAGAETVVRITGDCPLIDPALVDEVIAKYLESQVDYASNVSPPSFADGLDVEVFSYRALQDAWRKAQSVREREHVTPYIRERKVFKAINVANDTDLTTERWTVDEPEDLEVVRRVFEFFHPRRTFGWREVLALRHEHPEWFRDNQHLLRQDGQRLGSGQKLWRRAKRIIPGGNMLLSKRAEMFLPQLWPTYFSKAHGCRVWDLDGNEYIDMSLMGIGTNTLGYGHPEVDDAVKKTIDAGNMTTLNCPEEVWLAERLVELHPWADMVRLARSGGEACAVAIRIARAAVGRDKVAVCGYHGWHDWYLAANLGDDRNLAGHLLPGLEPRGVPEGLKGTVLPFQYNDLEELKRLVRDQDVGVIMMEVSRNAGPAEGFLEGVRELATTKGIVLIFDECTSGFRQAFGGLHKIYGVVPDMAVFGKTLGNGYAITAVVGRRAVMEAAQSTFISSTFWTERIGPTAALKTLQVMEREKSWERITTTGLEIRQRWGVLAAEYGLPIAHSGIPALVGFSFTGPRALEYKTFITQEMLKRGFLAGTAVYVCTEHSPAVLDEYFKALESVFAQIRDYESAGATDGMLEVPVCHAGFKRLN